MISGFVDMVSWAINSWVPVACGGRCEPDRAICDITASPASFLRSYSPYGVKVILSLVQILIGNAAFTKGYLNVFLYMVKKG